MKAIVIFECDDCLSGLSLTPMEFLGLYAQQMFGIKAVNIDIAKPYNLGE